MSSKKKNEPSEMVMMFESGLKQAAKNAMRTWTRDNKDRLFYEITSIDADDIPDPEPPPLPGDSFQVEAMGRIFDIKSAKLHDALETISERDKLIVLMYHLCGYEASEIGDLLNLAPKTVQNRLSIAREKLRG